MTSVRIVACLIVLVTTCVPAFAEPKADASLKIALDDPGTPVSPLLYGVFFEDINHAADGGLYAELMRNRAFDDTIVPARCTLDGDKFKTPNGWSAPFPSKDPMPGWKPVVEGGGKGVIALDDKDTLNASRSRALRIEVTSVDSGRVGVANEGYWGIPVRAEAKYRFAMFAKGEGGFASPLTVSLEGAKSEVYASAELSGIGPEWKRCEALLESNGNDANARLVIASRKTGAFRIGFASLFPAETWHGRENGLRTDLAEMLAELHPAFVRFPGGCFVEGFTYETAWRWKDMIGPIEQRKGHWNLWNYRATGGLGYHELLQMCEDLKAEPLYVFNCGMTCQGRAPELVAMDQLEPWVQDVLDAIEYANGPADSKWGAVRAANGHPEPFHLKYLEIGNENWGPSYEERYARFCHAIKEKYPEMRLVANCAVKSAPMDILDEHYYSSPDFFASRTRQYDTYDRKGPQIYVGEYAVVSECGKGNLRAALGEAAFMTGMERNGDVVAMASYAPLFVNVHDRCWNPDAIGFDNAVSFGTPSYHVQKLFSRHRSDVALPANLECETSTPKTHGGIGLATWSTRAEFKDVQVTGKDGAVLYACDFAKGAGDWKAVRGDWKAVDGAYRQSADAVDLRAVTGDAAWTDYTVTLKARKISGAEGFMVMVRALDENNWIWFNAGGWGNAQHGLEQMRDGQKSQLGTRAAGGIEAGRWYDVRVEIAGDHVRCSLDGQVVQEADLPTLPVIAVMAGRRTADRAIVIKAVNLAATPKTVDIALDGTGSIAPEGTEEVLAANPDDENSLAEPQKVAPVSRKVEGLSKRFQRTFPASSVTILTLKTN